MGLGYSISYETLTPDFSARKSDIVLKQIGEYIAEDIKRNIRRQQEFDGIPFEKLSDKRIRRKRNLGYPYPEKALIATGKMHDNINSKFVKRGTYRIAVDKRIRYKSGKSKSINGEQLSEIHQVLGAGTGRVIRAFIGLSARAEKYMNERIFRFVNGQFKSSNIKKTFIRRRAS